VLNLRSHIAVLLWSLQHLFGRSAMRFSLPFFYTLPVSWLWVGDYFCCMSIIVDCFVTTFAPVSNLHIPVANLYLIIKLLARSSENNLYVF
jgi:hypothetical protein